MNLCALLNDMRLFYTLEEYTEGGLDLRTSGQARQATAGLKYLFTLQNLLSCPDLPTQTVNWDFQLLPKKWMSVNVRVCICVWDSVFALTESGRAGVDASACFQTQSEQDEKGEQTTEGDNFIDQTKIIEVLTFMLGLSYCAFIDFTFLLKQLVIKESVFFAS